MRYVRRGGYSCGATSLPSGIAALSHGCCLRRHGGCTYSQGRIRAAPATCRLRIEIRDLDGQAGKVSERHAAKGGSGSIGEAFLAGLKKYQTQIGNLWENRMFPRIRHRRASLR